MPLDNCWAYGMTTLAEVVARVATPSRGDAVRHRLAPFAHLVGTGGGEIASGSIHRPLGQMASLLGRRDDALAHFDAARTVRRASRADIWVTHTDLDEAIARLRRGTEDDLRTALELLEDVDARANGREWTVSKHERTRS